MPGIPRSVQDFPAHRGAVRLVVIAFYHIAIGIALSHNRVQRIRMKTSERLGAHIGDLAQCQQYQRLGYLR